jgi:hypothetical protein
MYEDRRYIIINTSETGSINFEEVQQSNVESLRLSIDKTKTFVKYKVTEVTESYTVTVFNPETEEDDVQTIESGIYGRPTIYNNQTEHTYDEFLNVLTSSVWHSEVI